MTAESEVRRRINERDAITWAEFMDVALFWRDGGYYSGPGPLETLQDYYTSPQVHPAFGALLAIQMFQTWELLGRPDPFWVIELGAGNGLLCRDLAVGSNQLPDGFAKSLRYVCVDRWAVHGLEQAFGEGGTEGNVGRVAASGIPFRRVTGCFLSNELVDSFAVHQVKMSPEGLQEVYVVQEEDELTTTLGEPSTPALASRLGALGIELAEGQTAEINLALDAWAAQVAASLDRGFVFTVDYGHLAAELYSPERRYRGALTTYYRHSQIDAPFRHVGSQDITAQVDFSSAINAGHRNGLELLGFTTQSQFLRCLGLSHMQQRLAQRGLPQNAVEANRAGMLDLGRAGGLGDFKVLVQGKEVGTPRLWGLEPTAAAQKLVEELPAPLLTDQHLWLNRGRYTSTELLFQPEWPDGAQS